MTIVSYYDNRVSNWTKETFKEYLVNQDKGKFTTQTILPQEEIDQVNKDAEKFRDEVKKFYKGTLHFAIQPQLLSVLTTPWTKFTNLKEGCLIVNQTILAKIDSKPNHFNKNHNIPEKDIQKLPLFIADPLYITQSSNSNHPDRYIAILPLRDKKTGERISVIVQPSKDKRHAIVSSYGEIVNISEERKAKRLKYDKKLELSKRISTSSLK